VTTETVAAVKAILPMDVATYLQNNKRKEISALEEHYSLTIQLLGDPAGRQSEYDLEFVRRATPVVVDLAPMEKSRRREPAPTVAKSTSSTSSPHPSRGERDEVKERRPKPAVAVAEPPVESMTVNGEDVPVLAVARGRVFWRLAAATRRLEVGRATPTRSGSASGGRRHPGGRVMRRTRTWWRRRSSSSPNAEPAVNAEASKSNGSSSS
jgi:hypothetical protein